MMSNFCPVCTSTNKLLIDTRRNTPIFMNRLERTPTLARDAPKGDLEIVRCQSCGFVWNQAFDNDKIVYDKDYENDQTSSSVFQAHVDAMAARVIAAAPPDAPIDVLEIGCGQGHFLAAIARNAGPRLRSAIGFDPAFHNEKLLRDNRIRVYRQYFDREGLECLRSPPNLVVSRHTIEHVPSPVDFLKLISTTLRGVSAPVFIETPDVEWILRGGEIQDLFYEHCSLFSPASMRRALKEANLTSIAVDTVFDGQYLWAQASLEAPAGEHKLADDNAPIITPDFNLSREVFVKHWRERIRKIGKAVIVWGAGAKGVTFCFLVDPDKSHIAAVTDINPAKQNLYLPCTGHQVVAPDDLVTLDIGLVIVMNPNYHAEVCNALALRNISVDVVSIEGKMR